MKKVLIVAITLLVLSGCADSEVKRSNNLEQSNALMVENNTYYKAFKQTTDGKTYIIIYSSSGSVDIIRHEEK